MRPDDNGDVRSEARYEWSGAKITAGRSAAKARKRDRIPRLCVGCARSPVRREAVAALSVRPYLLDKLVGLWCWWRFR